MYTSSEIFLHAVTQLRLVVVFVSLHLQELLTQMNQQKIQPNLQTFNSVLKSLKRCASYAKTKSPLILNEMKAMGIGNY